MGTPHCQVGLQVLDYLIQNPERWTMVEPKNDISLLFEIRPTLHDFTADLIAAEAEVTLKVIDNANASRDEFLKDTAA